MKTFISFEIWIKFDTLLEKYFFKGKYLNLIIYNISVLVWGGFVAMGVYIMNIKEIFIGR